MAAGSEDGAPRTLSVAKTYNDAPFDYRMERQGTGRGFRIYRLTYPSPVKTPVEQNNTVPADYYLPDGAEGGPKRPAVIVLHILNGNYELERMLCAALASRGIPAAMFKLPYYGERAMVGGRDKLARNPALFVEALPQGIQDCRRTIDLLASRPEVDPQKVGVAGISLGGIVAATAAGSDPRVCRTALVLAGGDLLAVIHHCREARELSQFLQKLPPEERDRVEKAVGSVDPLRYAAGLKDRAGAGRVLMVNATEDDVIPRACTEKLADALGIGDKVVWLEGLGHYTAIAALPQTLRRTVDFFALDMPDGAKAPDSQQPAGGTPAQTLAAIVQQAAGFITTGPKAGRCHLVDLAAKVTDKQGKKYEGRARLVRGAEHRFRIEVQAPVVGQVALGQDDRPWIASAKTVFRGRERGDAARDPLAQADPKYVAKVRALAAGLSGLLLVPGMVEQALDVRNDSDPGGPNAILVTMKEKKRNTVRIVLDRDRRPISAAFDVDGVRGEVAFRAWQTDTVAPDELFQPPAGLAVREVDPADLYRIYSAMFDFLMEMTE